MSEDALEKFQIHNLQEVLSSVILHSDVQTDIHYFLTHERETGTLPNPWFDHLMLHTTNETGEKVAIGFIQGKNGLIQTVYSSSPRYASPRNIEGVILGDWNEKKVASVQPLSFIPMRDVQIIHGGNLSILPQEIIDKAQEGFVPIRGVISHSQEGYNSPNISIFNQVLS